MKLSTNGGQLSEEARAAAIRPLLQMPKSELQRLNIDPGKVEAAKKRVPREWVRRDLRLVPR